MNVPDKKSRAHIRFRLRYVVLAKMLRRVEFSKRQPSNVAHRQEFSQLDKNSFEESSAVISLVALISVGL
jgi:hypothetical protein